MESLFSDIPAEDGKIELLNFFTVYSVQPSADFLGENDVDFFVVEVFWTFGAGFFL